MIKRLLPWVSGLILTLWLCGTAVAAEPLITNQQQALELAKKLLPEIVGIQDSEVEFREDNYRGTGVWSLRLRNESPRPFGPYREGHIEINAKNGSLLSFYYRPNPADKKTDQQVVDRSQAKEIALNYLKKMQPNLINHVRLEDNPVYPYYQNATLELAYSFYWKRVVNGIPVQEDSIGIRVDAITGKVISYDFTWNEEATFPTPGNGLLRAESVAKLVLEKLELYPNYQMNPENGSKQKLTPVYQLNSKYHEFDAYTGQPIDQEGNRKEFAESKRYQQTFSPVMGGAAVSTEYYPGQQIQPTDAQTIAEQFFKQMGYSGKVSRGGNGIASGPGYTMEYWNYQIETNQTEKNRNQPQIDVSIETSTGKVVGFRTWNNEPTQSDDQTISSEQAKAIAEKFVTGVLAIGKPVVLRDENYLRRTSDEPYQFVFVRLIHGIPNEYGDLIVSVDSHSGKVLDYHLGILPVGVSSLSSIIDPVTASKSFKNSQFLELTYRYARDKEYRPMNKVQLVYRLKYYGSGIDAVTGQPLGRDALAIKPQLANHWARGPLELLADSRLLPHGDFNPDEKVTLREALRVLTATLRYYDTNQIKLNFSDIKEGDPDRSIFQKAVQMGILDNKGVLNPNSVLTREQMAVWLVNALGYQELARSPVKTEVTYQDLENNLYQNHIAFVTALRLLVEDKDGYFHPQQPITWAELATIVTRVAPKMNNGY